MGTLFVVATPIGNLEDITLRALRIFREVDGILCEDTRVTKKLLSHYDIHARVESYHKYSTPDKEDAIIDALEDGKTFALVCDAGTPGISDPGTELVARIQAMFSDQIKIESVPGASALTAALSIAGVPAHPMTFLGFPPHKKGRKTFFDTLCDITHTAVIYESTHRIVKALEAVHERDDTRIVVLVKELSKVHERVLKGTAHELKEQLTGSPELQKGEFVLILTPAVG